MKLPVLFLWVIAVFCSCTEILPPSYRVVLPALPDTWKGILSTPRWRIEWINQTGAKEYLDYDGTGAYVDIAVMQEWTTPILAYPYWPGSGLLPGVMKPAGALFPFDVDVEGGAIVLSWSGGIDATLYHELAAHAGTEKTKAFSRLPVYFNWVGFRELRSGDTLKEEVRADLWQVDWQALGARFVQSGFDRRALVLQARKKMLFPVAPGPWIGVSPFAPALEYKEGALIAFLSAGANTFVSSAGLLRCTEEAWILVEDESQ
ncbi:MAG: hypothetical protein LBB43_02355 [Spirochaetaceae bacterium]|jgi:hypothetical protein|nr:hypothetical protein [Spirochaetaceae bacterium]